MKKIFIIGICLLAGCTTHLSSKNKITHNAKNEITAQEKSEWDLLIGKWHGKQKMADGGVYEWLANRDADGKYQIHFKVIDKSGNLKDRTEVGEWGASGGVYFTIFKGWLVRGQFISNDSSDPNTRDSYKIISLNDKKFTYESLSNHELFTVEKVPDSFELK